MLYIQCNNITRNGGSSHYMERKMFWIRLLMLRNVADIQCEFSNDCELASHFVNSLYFISNVVMFKTVLKYLYFKHYELFSNNIKIIIFRRKSHVVIMWNIFRFHGDFAFRKATAFNLHATSHLKKKQSSMQLKNNFVVLIIILLQSP